MDNSTTLPLDIPVTAQAPTVECRGDACACCLYFTSDPVTDWRGLVGMLGVPGRDFETGRCNSL
jgi:hypothetical protein